MSTVSTNVLDQIKELHDRASELKSNFENEYTVIMQQISEVASGKSIGSVVSSPPKKSTVVTTSRVTTSDVSAPRRGRPPGSTNAKKSMVAVPKNAATVEKTTVAPDQRNYSNNMSLKEAVFNVLDRDNWDGILTLDPGVVSLGASEIKKVIMAEKKWVSSSADITSQLAGALGSLKTQGLVARENSRYFIPEGVEYTKS